VRDFHLVKDPRGHATLRAAPFLALPIGDRDEMPFAVVAVDLAESGEVRGRSAGWRILEGFIQ